MKALSPSAALCLGLMALVFSAGPVFGVDRDLARMESHIVKLSEKVTPSIVGVLPFTPQQRYMFSGLLPKAPPKGASEAKKQDYLRRLETAFYKIKASGSGFVVDRKGHIVTSTRAVPESVKKVRVVFHDGRSENARVVGRSRAFNVVVLKVSRDDLPPIAPGDKPVLGQMVMSAGNVFDISHSLGRFAYSLGTITGMYSVKAGKGYTTYYAGPVIETDAAINPGIYGGPLLDLRGRVVGLLSSTFLYQRFLGTAIPIRRVLEGVESILNPRAAVSGKVHAFPELGLSLAFGSGHLRIVSVTADGPSAKAGLQKGYKILEWNGYVPTPDNVPDLLDNARDKGKARLRVEREEGWKKTFHLKLLKPAKGNDDGEDF